MERNAIPPPVRWCCSSSRRRRETVDCETPYEACAGADAFVVANDDRAYAQLDWARIAELLRGKHVLDLRNRLDAAAVRRTGLSYRGVGRTRGRLVAS